MQESHGVEPLRFCTAPDSVITGRSPHADGYTFVVRWTLYADDAGRKSDTFGAVRTEADIVHEFRSGKPEYRDLLDKADTYSAEVASTRSQAEAEIELIKTELAKNELELKKKFDAAVDKLPAGGRQVGWLKP
mmetsp:Transcript_25044/g.78055  ORF Transcript_25044/g.78055 Transcript_25044/m.78055 type:complete len:133 (-) Transcript_25044:855-1253(-)